jgi:signal transduction histidine kinase
MPCGTRLCIEKQYLFSFRRLPIFSSAQRRIGASVPPAACAFRIERKLGPELMSKPRCPFQYLSTSIPICVDFTNAIATQAMADKSKQVNVLALADSTPVRQHPRIDADPASNRELVPCYPLAMAERRKQCVGRRQSEQRVQAELDRSHQELRELIEALDALRVEEQQRLAHEMHDDFGQLLAAMKMNISTLGRQLPGDDPALARHLMSIDQLADAMVSSVRRIVAGLPPKAIEEAGLYSALEFLTAGFEKHHGVACRLHLSRPEPALEQKVASAVYRMVQETLNNVAKHAAATHVEMRIDCAGSEIRLQVRDDGRGIAPEKTARPGAFGLVGMRQRVSVLGGTMSVDSNDGGGTVISIAIPIGPDGLRT